MAYGVLSTHQLAFGMQHVGDAGGSLTFTITNAAAFGPALLGAVSLSGVPQGVLGYQDDLSLPSQQFSILPGHSQTFTVKLSDLHGEAFNNPTIDPLKLVQVSYQNSFAGGVHHYGDTIGITGAVLNYANPWFTEDSGPGFLASTGMNRFILNLGDIAQGSAVPAANFSIKNLAAAPADAITQALTGLLPDFTMTVPASVNIGAGQTEHGWSIAANTGAALGYHDDTLSLTVAPGRVYTLVVQDHIV